MIIERHIMNRLSKTILILLAPQLLVSNYLHAQETTIFKCEKSFTMSKMIGAKHANNGTDYYVYEKGKYICDATNWDGKWKCLTRYRQLIEDENTIVGFSRGTKYPAETQTVTIDKLSMSFYRTAILNGSPISVSGKCTNIENMPVPAESSGPSKYIMSITTTDNEKLQMPLPTAENVDEECSAINVKGPVREGIIQALNSYLKDTKADLKVKDLHCKKRDE